MTVTSTDMPLVRVLEADGTYAPSPAADEYLPLIDALFVVSNPIPIKYALNHLGFSVGKPRLPLTEPDEKSAAVIKAALKDYSIDLPPALRR